jgi:hypothetical protein
MSGKIEAAGKIAYGAFRVVSGVMLATGHGVVGSFLRSHHILRAGMGYAKHSVENGVKNIEEGFKEWKRS